MRYPREVRLFHSRRLVLLVGLLGFASCIAGFVASDAWLVHAVILAATCLAGVRVVFLQAALHGRRLILADDGTCRWGEASAAHALVVGITDLGWAVWLRAANGSGPAEVPVGRGGALMLLSDQMSADDWRALRIWVRHKVRPPEEGFSEAGGTSPGE